MLKPASPRKLLSPLGSHSCSLAMPSRAASILSLVHVVGAMQQHQGRVRKSFGTGAVKNSACIGVTMDASGTFATLPVKMGKAFETVDLVVDTGSTELIVQDRHASKSTKRSSKEKVISYGSGDVLVEKATDKIKLGDGPAHEETIYLMEQYSSVVFDDLEGIIPLSMEKENYLHSSRFSLCYSKKGGSLHLNTSSLPNTVKTDDRWETSLHGVTVDGKWTGAEATTVLPDSGTTLILGPIDDVQKVLATACQKWSGCKSNGSVESDFAAFVMAAEKKGCDSSTAKGMPNLHFNMGGDSAVITSSNYMMLYQDECQIAMDYMDYESMWILGLPVFYEYNVNFDTSHLTVAFEKRNCDSCGATLTEGTESSRSSVVRKVSGHIRGPSMGGRKKGAKLSKQVNAEVAAAKKFFDERRKEREASAKKGK